MLGHGDAGGRCDNGHGGGDVEGVLVIASRPADVKNLAGSARLGKRRTDGFIAQNLGKCRDFFDGFPLLGKCAEELSLRTRFDVGGNQLFDYLRDLVGRQIGGRLELGRECLEHGDESTGAESCPESPNRT